MDPHVVPPTAPLLAEPRSRPAHGERLGTLTPRLSVVVVNYHHWEETAALVQQLRASPALRRGDAEVIVVDNNSPQHRQQRRLRRLTGVSLRRWRRNRGFARGVNEGCRLARGDWLLLLNPDVTLGNDFLESAMRFVERRILDEPRLGLVGFRLLNADGSPQPSTGPFPTLTGILTGLALPRRLRKYSLLSPSAAGPVDWATGCCLLVRRACWEQLGGFDPSYFLYYEDVDLCQRAGAAGWTTEYAPSPCAVHHFPLHGRPIPPYLRLVTRHALLTYASKHWSRWQLRILAGVIRTEARLRAFVARRRGDADAASIFAEMGRLTTEIVAGDVERAERRLLRVVYREEQRRAAAQHCHPQP